MKTSKIVALIAVVFIFFNVVLQAIQAETINIAISGNRNYDLAQQVYELTNKTRRERGVRTLAYDKELTEIAMKRAEEIALNFAHTRPNNTPWHTIATNINGENLAIGQDTPEIVLEQWMKSSTHRKNLLHTAYSSMGVGYFRCGNTNYWVQIFSAKKTEETPENIGETEIYTTEIEIEETKLGNLRLNYGADLNVKVGSTLELITAKIENSAFVNSNVERDLKYTPVNKDELTYTVSDTSIATIDEFGNVYGVSQGTVKVTATLYDKSVSVYINVKPNDNGTQISYNEERIEEKIRDDQFVKSETTQNEEDTIKLEDEFEFKLEDTQPIQEAQKEILLGDINEDGKLTADDAALIIDLFKTGSATQDQLKHADMNNDGKINVEDAAIVIEIFKTSK